MGRLDIQTAVWDQRGPFTIDMHQSDATATALLKRGDFGADIIHFEPGGCVEEHTHPGDHILFCIEGSGVVSFYGNRHVIKKGQCYLIPGEAPHAVYADADDSMTLLVVGNQHISADSPERLNMTGRESA